MASILTDFEYDLFISYRQKDNKYDGWVTEFVANLHKELEATFKEDISIYFDSDPHDGLLETHNVDKSLERKLKCLIFIPIISQTYCDPRSFAWQHEFCAFNTLAKSDPLGRDIVLGNGNVASRILPVKIHDIDTDDKVILENELGGVLRAIDFVYKEAGVNRPLKPNDKRSENQNKTEYRNQVNKVANAIKEIVGGLRKPVSSTIVFPGGVSKSGSEGLDSIAVLPFANMSSDPGQEYFSDGISEEIINVLVQLPNLKVAGRTSSFTFKGKNEDLRTIGEKLGVKTVLEGSVRSSGNRVRITAQLIDVETGFHLWSEKYDREMKDIFEIQDEIARSIVEELKLQLFEGEKIQLSKNKTNNLDAYNHYLKGRFFWNNNRNKDGIEKAIRYFEQSIEWDSRYGLAYAGIADAYAVLGDWGFLDAETAISKIQEFHAKSYELDAALPDNQFHLIYISCLSWDWSTAEREFQKAIKLSPRYPRVHHIYALSQMFFGNFNNAQDHNKRARELDPLSLIFNFAGGMIYYMTRRYDDAIALYRKALELDISFAPAHFWASFSYLQMGSHGLAIEEYQNLLSRNSTTQKLVPMIEEIFRKSGIEGFLHWLIDEGIGLHVGIFNQPYHRAVCYALLNLREQAFESIAEACEQHSFRIAAIKVEPAFDALRDDPRFSIYLKKVGLD